MATRSAPDPEAVRVARLFLARIADDFPILEAWLYGSRARGDAHADSDVDLAVILEGPKGRWSDLAEDWVKAEFDLLLDHKLLVSALPIWKQDWIDPRGHSNPWLLRNIKDEGVRL